MTNKIYRQYFFDKETKIIWHTILDIKDALVWEYLGTSDNPNPKMAAAAFMQQKGRLIPDGVYTGLKIREYTVE